MERRTFLTATAGLLAATAGCVGADPDDGPGAEPDGETATPTASTPSIADRSLERREECPEPGGATITTDGASVVVDGCIVGRNGCMMPVLDSATYDPDADELTVRVVTADTSDSESCTQQIVHRGYRATVEFDGGRPGTTVVVHDGMEGEREVARAGTGD